MTAASPGVPVRHYSKPIFNPHNRQEMESGLALFIIQVTSEPFAAEAPARAVRPWRGRRHTSPAVLLLAPGDQQRCVREGCGCSSDLCGSPCLLQQAWPVCRRRGPASAFQGKTPNLPSSLCPRCPRGPLSFFSLSTHHFVLPEEGLVSVDKGSQHGVSPSPAV